MTDAAAGSGQKHRPPRSVVGWSDHEIFFPDF
jgi:hypothetical protein